MTVLLDGGAPYHVGVVVPDLDAGMADHAAVFGSTWATTQALKVELCDHGGSRTVPVRITYAVQGPTHVELIEAVPGTVWEPTDGIHHVGRWCNDVDGESRRLEAAGYPAVAWARGHGGARAWFAYHAVPGAGLVELVDTRSRAAFERWMAGGDYR